MMLASLGGGHGSGGRGQDGGDEEAGEMHGVIVLVMALENNESGEIDCCSVQDSEDMDGLYISSP
jgi:hypothetical protein